MIEKEQQAFLLHSRPYQDHKYIVDLLTECDGKVSAIVYISKGKKNNKSAFLQPFRQLTVLLKGQHSLKNLSRVESTHKTQNMVGKFLFSGFYLNELLVRLMSGEQPCPELFHQYKQSVVELSAQLPLEKTLRAFEMALLAELGVLFDFSVLFACTQLNQVDQQRHSLTRKVAEVYFIAEQGFIPILNKQDIPCYTQCYQLQHIIAIAEQRLDCRAVMITYKRLMRQVINSLLGNKPLNSRKFFVQKSFLGNNL